MYSKCSKIWILLLLMIELIDSCLDIPFFKICAFFGCFQAFAIVNNTVINSFIAKSLCAYIVFS